MLVGEGAVVHRSTVATDPAAVAQHFAENGIAPDRIVHESGQLAAAGETDPALAMIADGFCAAHETLCAAAEAMTDDLKAVARDSGWPGG